MSASTGATAQKCQCHGKKCYRPKMLPAPMVMTMSVHHMYMEMIMEELERIADRGQVKMSQIEAKLWQLMKEKSELERVTALPRHPPHAHLGP